MSPTPQSSRSRLADTLAASRADGILSATLVTLLWWSTVVTWWPPSSIHEVAAAVAVTVGLVVAGDPGIRRVAVHALGRLVVTCGRRPDPPPSTAPRRRADTYVFPTAAALLAVTIRRPRAPGRALAPACAL
ncbi:hypothetical protein ACXVUM_02775 [Williamsia sp. SKLECPSW1]